MGRASEDVLPLLMGPAHVLIERLAVWVRNPPRFTRTCSSQATFTELYVSR